MVLSPLGGGRIGPYGKAIKVKRHSHACGLAAQLLQRLLVAAQGEDTDEVQNQPAWLREDAQDDQAPAENGGPPSLADLSLHQRNASAGAADYLGLGGAETPYANGDSHAQSGKRTLATQDSSVAPPD